MKVVSMVAKTTVNAFVEIRKIESKPFEYHYEVVVNPGGGLQFKTYEELLALRDVANALAELLELNGE